MDEHRVGMMLWRGKYLILIAVAAMLIAVAVLTLTTSKQYEATTILRVDQAAAPVNGSDAYNAQQASATQAVNYATLLTSTSFLQRVASKIENGFAFSGAGLGSHLGAHAITNTNLIVVTFTAGSRKDALHYARTVADQSIALFKADFVSTRTRQQAAAQAKLKTVGAKIAALQASDTPSARQQIEALTIAQTDLTRQYGQAVSEASSPSPVVLVAGPPSAPSAAVSPRPAFNAIIALFLGLLVGVGLAWLRERLTTGRAAHARRVATPLRVIGSRSRSARGDGRPTAPAAPRPCPPDGARRIRARIRATRPGHHDPEANRCRPCSSASHSSPRSSACRSSRIPASGSARAARRSSRSSSGPRPAMRSASRTPATSPRCSAAARRVARASALFLALTAATSFALIRHPERLPSRAIYYVPVVFSLVLFVVMVLRLPGPPADVYGSKKLETYLIVNVALLAAGIVVGTRRRDVRRSLGLMLIVALAAGLALVHEIATGVQPTFAGRYAISNDAYDPIALGRLAAAGLLIALYVLLAERKYRLVGVIGVPLMTVTLLASGGRGSLLGVVAGMAVLFGVHSVFAVRRSRILAAIAASVVVASLIVPGAAITRSTSVFFGGSEGLNSGGRTALWTTAWNAFVTHPLDGLGTGGFAALDLPENYPHNLLLEIASELGVIGLVPLLVTLGVGFFMVTSAIRRGPASERGLTVLVAALLASAFVNALFSTDIPANYDVWLYLGLGVGMASQLERPTRRRARSGN